MLLRVGVRDKEDTSEGNCNFIYVPSIFVPHEYRNNYLGTLLLIILFKTAHEMGMCCFVTQVINDRFFDHLLRIGGVLDASGDIELYYPKVLDSLGPYIAGILFGGND